MALLVTERALRDRRHGLGGWSIGIALYVGFMCAMYPAVQGSEMQQAIKNYPKELRAFFGGTSSFDFSTGAGYLNVELFSLVVPALLTVVAIAYGAQTLAGEQETGILDFLLANPITRRRVVAEKVAGLVATIAALSVVVAACVLVVGAFVDLRIGVGAIVIACCGAALLAIFNGVLAMLVGALTGSRAAAIGVATTIFVTGYLIVGLAGLVSWFKPVRILSPLYHANGTNPLRNGVPVANYLVLAALCLTAVLATIAIFDHRDLTR